MADKDADVRDLAQTIQLELMREYQANRKTMTGAQKATMLAEVSTFCRTVEASATGAAYPFFSPSAIAASLGNGQLADLHEQVTPATPAPSY